MNEIISIKVRKRLLSFIVSIAVILLLLLAGDSRGQGNDTQGGEIIDSVINIDSLNDGPHVFIRDDTTAVVFYLCAEELVEETRFGRDTVRFKGLCGDSGREYAVALSYKRDTVYDFEDVPRIFTVSDIHGEYGHFKDILINAGIVDTSLRWVWGDGHLVVLGDIFDRGSRVTECLWLVYRLQREARAAGGRVHFVLGNHELMILHGDNRYIHERYLEGIVRKTRIEHEDLYGPETALGRWLRVQPTVIKINGLLFVHGGVIPELAVREKGIEYINETVARGLDISSVRLAFEDEIKYLFGSYGPFWYRGYHYAMEDRYDRATTDEIDHLLDFYGVDKIVVGHSEHDRIEFLYDHRVLAVDVPVEEIGGFQGLLWENGDVYLVRSDGFSEPLE